MTDAPHTVLLDDAERQRVFRACLDALARPGTVHDLGCRRHEAARLPLLALTDLMAPVAALGDDAGVRAAVAEIATLTRAPRASLEGARWVLAPADPDPALLRGLPQGTDEEPQLGAMVVVPVASADAGDAYALSGPGIDGVRHARLGLRPALVHERAALLDGYPRGFDLLLVDPDARVVGLPRTTIVEPDEGSER